MRIIAASGYRRAAARLLSAEDCKAMEAAIAARPDAWPVVPGTGGARKARVPLPGRGKRSGARVIYYFQATPEVLALLAIYAKAAKEDLTHADRRNIREAIRAIAEAL
jgi:hypothetical protein